MALSCLFSRNSSLCDRRHLIQKVTSSPPLPWSASSLLDLTLVYKKQGPPVWRWDELCGWDSCFRDPHGVMLKPDSSWAPHKQHASKSWNTLPPAVQTPLLNWIIPSFCTCKSVRVKGVRQFLCFLITSYKHFYIRASLILLILFVFFAFISVGLLPPFSFFPGGSIYYR